MNRGLALLNSQTKPMRRFDAMKPIVVAMPQGINLRTARADALQHARRYEDAAPIRKPYFDDSIPNAPYARGNFRLLPLACARLAVAGRRAANRSRPGVRRTDAVDPFQTIALSHSQTISSPRRRIAVADSLPVAEADALARRALRPQRIRVAYLSADFNDHARDAMAGVFEHHDKARFETVAISLGHRGSERRERLAHGSIASSTWATRTASPPALLRQMEIDIAVDLMGYTGDCRPTSSRSAGAVQVNYLGFPGTMGPAAHRLHHRRSPSSPRRIAATTAENRHLPAGHLSPGRPQPADRRADTDARGSGFAGSGFVFCSFNNTYKIPPRFRYLDATAQRVEKSVLWLLATNDAAVRNLRREAERAA